MKNSLLDENYFDIEKQFAGIDVSNRFLDLQKQITESGIVDRFADFQKQIAANTMIDQITDLQRHVATTGVVDPLAVIQKQIADSTRFSSALGHVDQLVHDDRARWDQIAHSFDSVAGPRIQPPIMPVTIPNMAEQFERAFNARAERDREIQEQQFELLASIADAGKKQNETMAGIASL